jgi:adenosine kinase
MQIVVTGSIAVDRIMVFAGRFKDVIQPDKLHVLSLSLLLDELKETRGGVAANIAYSLALLGEKPVLLGAVGANGREYMGELARLGVDCDQVHYSQLPTASFSVITDQDDCQVGGFYPGAMGDAESLSFKPFVGDPVLFVLSPHDPQQMARQVDEAKQLGLRLVYDVGQQANNISGEDIRAGIEAAELVIVNDYEMGVMVEKTGWTQTEIAKKLKVCVITLGDQGCHILTEGQTLEVPAVKVNQVIDPTGAGDAFRAGFLYGYVRDWPLETAARLGATVATFALGQAGTQEHHFTKSEVALRYQSQYSEDLIW